MLNSFLKQRSDLEEAFKDLANDIKSFPDSVIVNKDGGINTESMDALNKAFTEKQLFTSYTLSLVATKLDSDTAVRRV